MVKEQSSESDETGAIGTGFDDFFREYKGKKITVHLYTKQTYANATLRSFDATTIRVDTQSGVVGGTVIDRKNISTVTAS